MIALLLATNLLQANMNPIEQVADIEQTPAFHDHKEWFAAFLKNTDQKEVQKEATLYILQEHFPHIWERIRDTDYPFTSVFVGTGSGGMEIPLMREFVKARGSAINFGTFCEDPSPQMKKEFFAAATKEIEDQIAEYSLLSFDDPSYLPPQADLALASHVWYFIEDWKMVEKERNTLVKFASLLSQRSGAGIITLQSKTGDRYKLNSACASLRGANKERVAEEIITELERLGIEHKVVVLESHLNMSSCFNQGGFSPNEEGRCLLSFLLFTRWEDLPIDVQEQMKAKFIAQMQDNGKEELIMRDFHIWIAGNKTIP